MLLLLFDHVDSIYVRQEEVVFRLYEVDRHLNFASILSVFYSILRVIQKHLLELAFVDGHPVVHNFMALNLIIIVANELREPLVVSRDLYIS